jgi:2,4-dienoyl-CoA reductase-like NADH-dependent reductase (Old Yellow Enzyme family)
MRSYPSIGGIRTVADFKSHLASLELSIPCDDELQTGPNSPLAASIDFNGKKIGNRFCIHPMEGWDGTADGKPTEATIRRWRNFGLSGAKLIWGGEAVAVRHDGRANPNQLLMSEQNKRGLADLRDALLSAHREVCDTTDDLLLGLQLTHSGRFSRPNEKTKPEPRILYRHPTLDSRVGIKGDFAVLTDSEIRQIIDDFLFAARVADELGYDFVDIKHCHGYLGHEFLSAARAKATSEAALRIARASFVRSSPVFEPLHRDCKLVCGCLRSISFLSDRIRMQHQTAKWDLGYQDSYEYFLPYDFGFGVDVDNPERYDLTEPHQFLSLLAELDIRLVNLTAGSPYYNPHIQRPALYPPSDGYEPPEDPLFGVARQMEATRVLKKEFKDLILVGTAYTYLQEFLPYVAQAAVNKGWVDSIGLGRMVLSYPELPLDIISGRVLTHKKICRTFSDCTTAPRNGLPSGCYPLDGYYKQSELGVQLKQIKAAKRSAAQVKS